MSGWTIVPEPQQSSPQGWTPVAEPKPFSVPGMAGKTALKLGEAAVNPNFIGQGNNHPDYSDYQWGVLFQRDYPQTVAPDENLSGFHRFMAKVTGQPTTVRHDFTPRNPQEQAEYDKVMQDLHQPGGIVKTVASGLKDLSPVDLNVEDWRQDPTEAASTSLANLIALRQGFKKLPGEIPAAGKAVNAVGSAIETAAPYVGKGAKEAARFGGVGEFIHTGNPLALAGPVVAPLAEKLTTSGITRFGRFLQRAGADAGRETALTPEQQAAYEKVLSEKKAVPADSEPPVPAAATPAPVQAPPKTSQVLKDAGVTQAMKDAGVAAPSASMRPVRPGTSPQMAPRADLQFPPGLSGEDAALIQLTRQNINELRFIAQKRGLPVTPKDTHVDLINKIHDSLKPEEIQGFQAAAQTAKPVPSKFAENNAIADSLNDEAAQLQASKGDPYRIATLRNAASTIRQYPQAMSEVDFGATKIRGIDKGIRERIANTLKAQKAVPAGDEVATTTGQPMSIEDALRQSLMQRGIAPR